MAIYCDIIKWGITWWLMNFKVHMKRNHFRGKNWHRCFLKIAIHQNMIMIWTYENIYGPQKSITSFIKVFLTIFLHLCSYCFDISYIESIIESIYKISQIKTIHKNACIKRQRKKTSPYISTSKFIKLYLVYINTYINKCISTLKLKI
jgi:hypothetical protein